MKIAIGRRTNLLPIPWAVPKLANQHGCSQRLEILAAFVQGTRPASIQAGARLSAGATSADGRRWPNLEYVVTTCACSQEVRHR